MAFNVVRWVLEDAKAKNSRRLVLLVLAEHADADGAESFPSYETIQSEANLSRGSVSESLRALEKSGEIERDGTRASGTIVWRVCAPPERLEELGGGEVGAVQTLDGGSSKIEPEPSSNRPSVSGTPRETPPQKPRTAAKQLWEDWERVMGRRHRAAAADELRIINAALRVASPDEIAACFRACEASDYHMKRGKHKTRRGGKYDSVGKILKPRPTKGETQRSRIDWWLEQQADKQPQKRYRGRKA